MFRMGTKGRVIRGEKVLPDGQKEIVELVYPTAEGSTLLNNNEFGQWMSERASKSKQDLVYFNSSCWSDHKATYEIAAANTARFVNIPTTTMMLTFSTRDTNAMRLTLDAFRNKKDYSTMRSELQKNEGYQSGKMNHFIFPDEQEYVDKITSVVGHPISINTQITVDDGKGHVLPYSLESAH